MEEYVVYILYSKSFDKTYVGFTSSIIDRIKSHNLLGTNGYTKNFRPWEVVHIEYFESKTAAIKREKYLKTGVGREYIKKIIPKL